jgi:hypothetical protein
MNRYKLTVSRHLQAMVVDKKKLRMDFTIPNIVGIPTVSITFLFGLFKFLEGSVFGALLSVVITVMSGIYMYFKIRGQQLDNRKKKLRLTT